MRVFSFVCGIDIAKNNHEASIIDEKGRLVIESISFSNSQKGCEKLFEKFEIIPENIVIGMEATGHYWLSVYSFLVENDFNVKVINPIQSEAFARCTYAKLKTIQKILL